MKKIAILYQFNIPPKKHGIQKPLKPGGYSDSRADNKGKYYLFDLNLKPNMTGPSRSHRANQDSLSSLAAIGIGWNYFDLLKNMINQKWKPNAL